MIDLPTQWESVKRRYVAASALATLAWLGSSGTGSAAAPATASDSASATVSLDSPGTVSLDAFDPALGGLTTVEVSVTVEVVVQVCVENTGPTAGSLAEGSVSGSLSASFAGGVGATSASAAGSVGPTAVAAGNGVADCAGGYDASLGRFPGGVSAGDAVFTEGSDRATQTATLTGADVAAFVGPGSVALSFTPGSDSALVVPASWDSLVVGQGVIEASVTYTYTPGGTSPTPPGGGGGDPQAPPEGDGLPVTGAASGRVAVVAAVVVVVGVGVVLVSRRWRVLPSAGRRSGGALGVVGLVVMAASTSTVPSTTTSTEPPPPAESSTTSEVADTTTVVETSSTVADPTMTTSTSTPESTSTTSLPPPESSEATDTTESATTTSPSTSLPAATSTSSTTSTTLPLPDEDDVEVAERLPDTREQRPITFPVVGGGSFGYGWMDCRDVGCVRFHKGTDIMAAKLQPLVSPVDGVVERLLEHRTAGVGVIIRGDDGYQYRLYHLNNDNPGTDDGRAPERWRFGDGLAAGVRVAAGELVGLVGDSGNAEDYLPHLHFEIHRPDGRPINPYWSLQAAARDGLMCAAPDEVTEEWVRVAGVSVSPVGFRPDDDSLCAPEPEVALLAVSAAAVPASESVSVPLSAAPQSVEVAQFDPALGALELVTLRVAVDADASVDVTNLTGAAQVTTVSFEATATLTNAQVGSLSATAAASQSGTIAAGATAGFALGGSGEALESITDPVLLAAFVGTGTVSAEVVASFAADVAGPATWRGQGSGDGTVTVTVAYNTPPEPPPPSTTPPPTTTAQDQPPVAVEDTASVLEDAAATPIGVLANDVDPDGGPMSIGSVTQPANGIVAIIPGGSGLTYEPNANYCNDPPGTTLDTFTYALAPGGSTATVAVTVTCQPDTPLAVDDTATVAEDVAATVIDVLANDSDPDPQGIAIADVTQPANGTVVAALGGSNLTYQPDPDYCNDPPGDTADTFTYRITPGDPAPATVAVTVTCVDDPPEAVDDTATVTEDDPATAIEVLANDTDIDGGPISIDAGLVTDPANGTAAVAADGLSLTYLPDPEYCNDPPGSSLDTFEYGLAPGGSTATVTVTVTCVDDPPVAVDDTATVDEDDPATAIEVLANDTDIDGGPISIDAGLVTDPANGTVAVDGLSVTYTPDPDYCNDPPASVPDTFQYGLAPGGSTATVSVTVTCIADTPVAVDDTATVVEDAAATAIDVLANDRDPDPQGMTIDSVTQPANGTVTMDDDDLGLSYQPDADYCNTDAGGNPDTFTYTLDPGNDTADVEVTVICEDDVPVAVDDTATVDEDSTASTIDVLANDIDPDGGSLIDSVTQPDNGTVAITNDGADLTYAPNPEYCNSDTAGTPDTFTYTLTPAGATPTATVSVTVTCIDDPPVAVDDTPTVTEDDPATAIDVLANDTDIDGGPIAIAAVSQPANGTVEITNGGADLTYTPDGNYCNTQTGGTPDTFTYTLDPGGDTATVSVTVTCVDDPPEAVDDTQTVEEDSEPTTIDVLANDVDPDGDPFAIAEVTQPANGAVEADDDGLGLSYQPNADYCNTDTGGTPDTFTYTLTPDGDTATVSVTVTCVDDPPVAVDDAVTIEEDSGLTAIDVLDNDTDIDGGPIAIDSASDPANGSVLFDSETLSYTPDADYCNTQPGGVPDTFTYTLAPGGNTATVSVTVTCINDPPVAANITFDGANAAIGNTALVVDAPGDGPPSLAAIHKSITGDILAEASDVDGPGPLAVVAGEFPLDGGGTVTFEADGDFIYTPAPVMSCDGTDHSLPYTITDQHPDDPRTATGIITIDHTDCVWYVDNTADVDGDGTSVAPFDTLSEADNAFPAQGAIFVFEGDGTTAGYSTGIILAAGQRLIGEAATLVVGGTTLHTGVAANRPTLTNTAGDVVTLGANSTVTGVDIDPQGTGGGIAGGFGATDGTIADVNIVDTGTIATQPGLELDSTGGTWTVTDLTVSTTGAVGVWLNRAGTVNFTPTSTISITTSGARGLDATATDFGTSGFDTITVTDSIVAGVAMTDTAGTTTFGSITVTDSNGGVEMTNTSGATTFDSIVVTGSGNRGVVIGNSTGSTTFNDLDLTTSGPGAAFNLVNAGTVTIAAAATANISATGGPAVAVVGTPGATLSFDTVTSTNSTSDGINLDGLAAGTFTANATSAITGAAGIAFDLNGGSGAITYPGAINDGTGASVEITGRTGGAVTISGAINDGVDTGGGITVTGNSGGTTTFSGSTKALNTGAGNAVVLSANAGHTINFTGGGLDIDTTGGAGFSATGVGGATSGGTVTVQGADNTIDTTTGTALSVANTTIGAADITFRSISANGAPSGIVLSNTGSSGNLAVTGSGSTTQGGDSSGGTIQNTTGHGISLVNTAGPTFRNMRLANTGGSGVNGTQVTGFTFVDGTITGAGDASDENSITFDDSLGTTPNLTGAVTITNNVISQTEAEGIDILNFAGTITSANVLGNALSDTGDLSTPGSAISIIAGGTPTTAASITSATVANNTITNFRAGAGVQIRAGNVNPGGPAGHAGIPGTGNVIAVTGNSMNGGGGGVGNQPDRFFTGGVNGIGQGNFNISNNGTAANRIRNIDCIAIEVQADGPATMTSTVQNNFINANSAVGCAGIAVGTDDPMDMGAGTHTTTIAGNNVMGTDGPGIFAIVRDSASTMTAKVLNNTVAAPIATTAARSGIRVDSGSTNGDTTLCLEISGNTTAGSTNTATGTTSPGISLRKQGTDPAVNSFGIEGLPSSPAGTPTVENHVNANNTSTSGTFGVGGTALLLAQQGFTSCVAP